MFSGSNAVEIRRLSVPRWIQNGTEDAVVLDCEYVYTENDIRLVVKWFFEDNLEPVYQWIPGLKKKHASEMLKNRLDLNFSVSTNDAYSVFRALKILKPTTELSGKYTCLVTSLAGQDSKEQVMTVFVPAHEFELSYMETNYNTVNVSCETLGVFPYPNMRLYLRPSNGSPPQAVTDIKTRSIRRPSGSYDVLLHRSFMINELSSKGATVFECILELPGTNYFQSKRIAYLPGT
ncbi:ig-like domain-containing protein [Trichonephila clavipes]|nr:ig-like domain-containing protein [Trichonephila clavipes]